MFFHKMSDVQSKSIGNGTKVWQFSVVLPEAKIGENCNICAHCFIENDVIIGENVTLKCGVYIWDGIEIGNDVFIGPAVTFTNDKHPKSKVYPQEFLKTKIEDNVSIGANATILPGITLGKGCVIGAGSVVTKSVPPYTTVVGNPAREINNREK